MTNVDVWALQRINALDYGSGNYQALVEVAAGEAFTGNDSNGYRWIKIARNISRDDSYKLMNGYPTATRSRCEDCNAD